MNTAKPNPTSSWNVFDLCYDPPDFSYALIVLNTALRDYNKKSHFIKLWRKASVRISVDGGTNEFHSQIYCHAKGNGHGNKDKNKLSKETEIKASNGNDEQIPLPHIISGDFDSIKPDILQFYKDLGVKIVPTPDQDETDFTKALLTLGDHLVEKTIQINHVLVFAGMNSDRFDHTLANLNTLYKIKSLLPHPVIVICGQSLLWLLEAGSHTLLIPRSLLRNRESSWCGYVAFSEPVLVSTSGLKWDVRDKTVAFGQLISTSNTYAADCEGRVAIECSNNLLWTMGWDPSDELETQEA
ncbi:UNVERIFIED_CONTAM: hypothetical protein GTU68_060013 [Idotea baltica]|nr:hypothetical protein [Idotea baltica]